MRVMLREHLMTGSEASALVTRGPQDGSSGPHARSSLRQSKRTYCEHCKKMGHTKRHLLDFRWQARELEAQIT